MNTLTTFIILSLIVLTRAEYRFSCSSTAGPTRIRICTSGCYCDAIGAVSEKPGHICPGICESVCGCESVGRQSPPCLRCMYTPTVAHNTSVPNVSAPSLNP